MNTYELNEQEIELVITALQYTAEHGYTYEMDHGEDLTNYRDMIALLARLDPKPVIKEAWMIVYPDDSRSRLFDTERGAREWCVGVKYPVRIARVTWEQ